MLWGPLSIRRWPHVLAQSARCSVRSSGRFPFQVAMILTIFLIASRSGVESSSLRSC